MLFFRLAVQIAGPNDPQLLAYIDVEGGKVVSGDLQQYVQQTLYDGNPQLPSTVRDVLKAGNLEPWAPFTELPPLTDPKAKPQQAAFEIGEKGFTVNGASYNPDVVNITRQVNTGDAWELTAPSTKTNPGEPHIFHIHVNPFEIMDVTSDADGASIFEPNGKCKASVLNDPAQLAIQYCNMWHVFKDTIFVEPGYTVHTHTFYDRYIGEFVIHCHILDHEDAGMMLNINIVPDLKAPGGGLGMSGMHGMSHDH